MKELIKIKKLFDQKDCSSDQRNQFVLELLENDDDLAYIKIKYILSKYDIDLHYKDKDAYVNQNQIALTCAAGCSNHKIFNYLLHQSVYSDEELSDALFFSIINNQEDVYDQIFKLKPELLDHDADRIVMWGIGNPENECSDNFKLKILNSFPCLDDTIKDQLKNKLIELVRHKNYYMKKDRGEYNQKANELINLLLSFFKWDLTEIENEVIESMKEYKKEHGHFFRDTYHFAKSFQNCYPNLTDEQCLQLLGVRKSTYNHIYQEGDTGIGGNNIDEYYSNAHRAVFIPHDWDGVPKEKIHGALKRLHHHYHNCFAKLHEKCAWLPKE